MNRVKKFEEDIKTFGNPTKSKDQLNLQSSNFESVAGLHESDITKMGFKYGLVGSGNKDTDLLWIAKEALLNRMKHQQKEAILKDTWYILRLFSNPRH